MQARVGHDQLAEPVAVVGGLTENELPTASARGRVGVPLERLAGGLPSS
jgi:hypothetical protein